MQLVIEANGPGTLTVSGGKVTPGKTQYVTVAGVGVSANVQTSVIVKEGVHDCKVVKMGVRDAFKAKGSYDPSNLFEYVVWTQQEIIAFYVAKAKELGGGK